MDRSDIYITNNFKNGEQSRRSAIVQTTARALSILHDRCANGTKEVRVRVRTSNSQRVGANAGEGGFTRYPVSNFKLSNLFVLLSNVSPWLIDYSDVDGLSVWVRM